MDMDLTDIFSMCNTSHRFNDVICLNNNFWYNKLKQDFDIDYKSLYPVVKFVPEDPNSKYGRLLRQDLLYGPKDYYVYIRSNLSNDRQRDLINAAMSVNLDRMKAAITQGADVNLLGPVNRHILYYPASNNNLEMVKYIVNQPNFNKTKASNLYHPTSQVNSINANKNKEVYEYLVFV